MDSRGVMTVDLIFATFLIIVVAGSIITIASDRIDTVSETGKVGNARMTAENIAGAINKVYSGGNGHSMTISLPADITGKKYYINVNSSGVYVNVDGMIGKAHITPKRISGSNLLHETQIIMHNGANYTIKNVNGSDGCSWILITES